MDPACFAPDANEPLGLWTRADRGPSPLTGLRRVAFEYSSRGDRVPGRILLPPVGGGPFPIALLAHGERTSDAATLDAVAEPWVRGGAAVASIDLPLCGARASAKLGGLLCAGSGGSPESSIAAGIRRDFARQAVLDLRRCLDALARVDGLDGGRVAFVGLGLGAMVGAAFCALDPRPWAVVLALAGAGSGAPELDPLHHVARIAPRPILFVNATRDANVPRAAAERLHAAAGEPREVVWVEAGEDDLPGRALEAIGPFLGRHLGLSGR